MGQKSNPIGLRLQINRTWDSRWYADGADYGRLLLEDLKLRKFILKTLPQAAISKVVIERPAKTCRISIYAARPGVIIGKKGADIEKLRKTLAAMTTGDVSLNIVEIRKPEIDSKLVAQGVADQLERRIAFRRAMKRAVQNAQKYGAEGIRIQCSGRLGGAEMCRTEWYREGRVPLHTLRADIDYGFREAATSAGRIGVKVWLYKGEILPYKTSDDHIAREAAMAVGHTSGSVEPTMKVVTSAGPKVADADEVEVAPLVKEADPEFERLLAEEEDIQRRIVDSHETPKFGRE